MIVKCSNCSSSFAVNDEKVENKKFAFNCPNCSTENVIDNREEYSHAASSAAAGAVTGGAGGRGKNRFQLADEPPEEHIHDDDELSFEEGDSAFDETSYDEKGEAKDESFVSGEEVETAADEPIEFGEDDFDLQTDEEKPAISEEDSSATGDTNDLSFDDTESETAEVEAESEESTADMSDSDPAGLDDISFDDLEEETPEADQKTSEPEISESDIGDLDDIAFDEIESEAAESEAKPEEFSGEVSDSELEGLDDIDFAEIEDESVADEKPAEPEISENEIGDLDDFSFDEIEAEAAESEAKPEESSGEVSDSELADLDDLAFDDLEEKTSESDKEPGELESAEIPAEDLEDTVPDEKIDFDESDALEEMPEGLEDITLDEIEAAEAEAGYPKDSKNVTDELGDAVELETSPDDIEGIDEEDISSGKEIVDDYEPLETPVHEEEVYTREKPVDASDDETLTVDLDSVAETESGDVPGEAEDDITLDLDTLDIEIDDESEIKEGEKPDEYETVDEDTGDDDITLNLDELDITLDETEEITKGEEIDEDEEKLTLDDAGLTLDEIASDAAADYDPEDEEEDIRLTIDDIDPDIDLNNIQEEPIDENDEDLKLSLNEIDPGLTVNNFESKLDDIDEIISDAEESGLLITETDQDELPDIDIDEYFDEDRQDEELPVVNEEDIEIDLSSETSAAAAVSRRQRSEDFLDRELTDIDEVDIMRPGKKSRMQYADKGSLNLSVDFSLKHSRLMAFFRLTAILLFGLIPHFAVLLLYRVLSAILGFFNQLVVLMSGRDIEDFFAIQENTLRYRLSVEALLLGAVDEMPVFAGRSSIDHPLQLNITYPLRHSRLLAALRISVAGILIIMLPHLVLYALLSIAMPVAFLIAVFSVLITSRVPHFISDFIVRYLRYSSKISAFMTGLIDEYPSFRFD